MKRSLFFCLFFLAFSTLFAQQDRLQVTPKSFRFKPEFRLTSGLSVPFGNYKKNTDQSGLEGNARLGFFTEFEALHRLQRAPVFALQITTGFALHPTQSQAIQTLYNLPLFQQNNWQMIYLFPGAQFQRGKTLKVGLKLGVGLIGYSGWKAIRGAFVDSGNGNIQFEEKSWNYNIQIAGGFQADFWLGLALSKRTILCLQTQLMMAQGARQGTLTENYYEDNPQNNSTLTPIWSRDFTVLHQTSIFALQVGIGIRYVSYRYLKHPDLFKNPLLKL